MRSVPVKYLGTFLGLGDLSKMNFERPLQKAKSVMSHWQKQSLTLDARILVIKTFVFSVFVHVLNTVYITTQQLEKKKLINDILWQGQNKVKQSVMVADYIQGGLKMFHVKNIVHELRVKWMHRLSEDKGLTWSRYIWREITSHFLPDLIQGIRQILQTTLCMVWITSILG